MSLTDKQRAYYREYNARRRRERGMRPMAETRKGIASEAAIGPYARNINRRIKRRALRKQQVGPTPAVEFGLAVGRMIRRKMRNAPIQARVRKRTRSRVMRKRS